MGTGAVFNTMYVLNTMNMQWSSPRLSPVSIIPSARACHTMVNWNNCLVMFGGCDSERQPCEPQGHLYDTSQNRWIKFRCRSVMSDSEPPSRFQHSGILLHSSKLFIFGGAQPELFSTSSKTEVRSTYTNTMLILYHLEKVQPQVVEEPTSASKPSLTRGLSRKFGLRKEEKPSPKVKEKKVLKHKDPAHLSVGLPYNLKHKVHVNFDFQWSGQNPSEVFILQEKLGEGSFGAVYKATHKDSGFVLAIKEIEGIHGQASEDLKKEIEILKKCKHSNVVTYFGTALFAENKIWVMMDFCELGSIRDLMVSSESTFLEEEIAFIVGQVRICCNFCFFFF